VNRSCRIIELSGLHVGDGTFKKSAMLLFQEELEKWNAKSFKLCESPTGSF
jgi:hypothetical protein